MHSSSTESLDLVGQREKYLKNTFESLSGAEQDSAKDAGNGLISVERVLSVWRYDKVHSKEWLVSILDALLCSQDRGQM
jgi:hypothetical protein